MRPEDGAVTVEISDCGGSGEAQPRIQLPYALATPTPGYITEESVSTPPRYLHIRVYLYAILNDQEANLDVC